MSIEMSIGDVPPPVLQPSDAPAVDAGAPPITESVPAPELQQLTETFGGDFTGFSSVEDAQRAALLIAQSYAQAGAAPTPPVPVSAPAPAPVSEVEDDDYGDLDPKVVARIKRMDTELKQSRAESKQFQERLAQEQTVLQGQQQQEVLNRALSVVDSLADPRYGVGGNQNFSQQMARENLLRTADRIITGMRTTGRGLPNIEKVIHMAVLAESGKLPAASKAGASKTGAPPAPVAGATQIAAPVGVPRRKTGTELDTYMHDNEFMTGARAILNRGRR